MSEENNATLTSKIGGVLGSWKVKVAAIAVAIVAVGSILFFWAHIIAGFGLKAWSSRANANPIECMIQDTNDDSYVSCTALLDGEVVPLECGSSLFNIGCRVNYGAAAPKVREKNRS